MKKVRRIFLVLIVLLLGGATAGYVNLSRMVRAAVVRETTLALRVPTSVASASLALSGHVLKLNEFCIDNPPGFSSAKLLTLSTVDLDVPYSQLDKRPIHLNAVKFYGPRLMLEHVGGKWNVQCVGHKLLPGEKPLRLTVGTVTVLDAVVTLRPNLPGLGQEITVNVPPFTMTNLHASDGGTEGATIQDALHQITEEMINKAQESGQLSSQLAASIEPPKIVGDIVAGVGWIFHARQPATRP